MHHAPHLLCYERPDRLPRLEALAEAGGAIPIRGQVGSLPEVAANVRQLDGLLVGAGAPVGADVRDMVVAVRARAEDLPIVVLAEPAEASVAFAAAGLGVDAVLVEPAAPADLARTLRETIAGEPPAFDGDRRDALSRAFGVVVAARDPQLADHLRRTGEVAAGFGAFLNMADEIVTELRLAGELHDLGKLALSDRLLQKRGPLDADEWADLRRHPAISADLLGPYPELASVAALVRVHHERFDGFGYPDGLRADDIPVLGRMLSIADAFDAMCHQRPYQPARHPVEALAEIERHAGTQFDPQLAGMFSAFAEAELMVPAPLGA